jgi:hypothetical protein
VHWGGLVVVSSTCLVDIPYLVKEYIILFLFRGGPERADQDNPVFFLNGKSR